MGRKIGGAEYSGNFEVRFANPLDARQVVDTVADLTQLSTWDKGDGNAYVYKGLLVSVVNDIPANIGVYMLINNDALDSYTHPENWIKLAIGGGLYFEDEIIGDGEETIFHINHNLGTKRHITEIYDEDDEKVYVDIKVGINTDDISFYSSVPNDMKYKIIIIGF